MTNKPPYFIFMVINYLRLKTMKIYQVGGSVRDKIMNIPPHDIDYVVIGSTIDEMLSLGFKQVGKDFPVFINPHNGSEYALARKEQKSGNKHGDFKFEFSPSISLKEDLIRRDFTCNALALNNSTNQIIDYFNGQKDIKEGILRHISPHFAEDPLRVLRMCRFAAQLNFKIAPETMSLARQMVKDGALAHLSAERVWQEIYRALETKNFDIFITTMQDCGALDKIMPEISALFATPERLDYHPEGNSGAHTLLCLKNVALQSPKIKFATLLHDIGKTLTPKDALPHHHGHDATGPELIKSICSRLKVPHEYKNFAILCCQNHMKLHLIHQMRASTLVDFTTSLGKYIDDFITVCQADFFGRGYKLSQNEQTEFYKNASLLQKAHKILSAVKATDMPDFSTLPKDKSFGRRFRAFKINILKQKLKFQD